MMGWRVSVFLCIWLLADLALPVHSKAEPLPRSVLILDQSVPALPFSQRFANEFRHALSRASTAPLSMYVESLDLGRFGSPEYNALLQAYLQNKYRDRPIGVVVTLGTAAFELLLQLHPDFLASAPVVFTNFDDSAVRGIPANATGTIIPLRFRNLVLAARALVPDLKRLALVGDPFERQPYRHHYRQELKEFTGDLEVIDLSGLPLDDVKARVATLPTDAAIIYTAIYTDAAGVQYNTADALQAVSDVANRPIVVDSEVSVGAGATGGIVVSPEDAARESARLAARLLGGETAADIPVDIRDLAKPVFDARQLKRWRVSETLLPAGSEIQFREQPTWRQYGWLIATIAPILLFQTAMIAWLLTEHRRRRVAELEARRRLMEVAQMDRTLTAGAMSASIAHELNQPLSAILSNAEAAEMLLNAPVIDLPQIKEILADIRRDDQRAAEIIRHLRALLKHSELDVQDVDLNELIADTVHMLEPEAADRGVVLSIDRGPDAMRCRADPVHLQQVVLNLAINGMDAMQNSAGRRRLQFQIAAGKNAEVTVSVADTGVGIPPDKLKSIFEPLVTTKQQGTGLGLSIARSIITAYGGKIWAENRAEGGAVFHFTLAQARDHAQSSPAG
jgi:signal transduction histidine kinase